MSYPTLLMALISTFTLPKLQQRILFGYSGSFFTASKIQLNAAPQA